LRAGVWLAPADGARWQARWGFDQVTFLEGQACQRVLPWLVERLPAQPDRRQLAAEARMAGLERDLNATLDQLIAEGLVIEEPVDHAAGPTRLLGQAVESLWADPQVALRRVANATLIVCGNSLLSELLVCSAARQGFSLISRMTTPTAEALGCARKAAARESAFLPVADQTSLPLAELEAINESSLALRFRWLLVGAWNERVLVGPLFIPGATACLACFRARLASHRAYPVAQRAYEAALASAAAASRVPPVVPAIAGLAAELAALELFRAVSGIEPPQTAGRLMVFNPSSATCEVETLLKVPWCPVCQAHTPAGNKPSGGT